MKEFAALHGVSKQAVSKWKTANRLVFVGDKVDVKASNLLIERHQRGGGKRVNQSTTEVDQLTDDATVDLESIDEAARRIIYEQGPTLTLDEARTLKENYLALLNQLEYDKESGVVVAVADVAAAVGAEYAKVRTRLLSIPAEQAPRIHRLKTVNEVQDVLQEIITEALEELTRHGGR